MKKPLAFTALAATLALALSGCAFSLESPESETSTQSTPGTQQSSTDDQASTGGSDAEALTESAECTNGEPIDLAIDDAVVQFTGICGDVTISGDSVAAEFEQVGNVSISGSDAAITFSGSALNVDILGDNNALKGKQMGAITVGGDANTLMAAAIASITVSGDANAVTWQSNPSAPTDTGTDNTLFGP